MTTMTLQQAFDLAMQYQQAGQPSQAEAIYRHILGQQPNHPDALHRLGALAAQTGRAQSAVELIGRAIGINPGAADYHHDLGNAWNELRDLDRAIACFQRALELRPDDAGAYYNLGNAWMGKGQWEQAIACFQRALQLKPDYAGAYNNLGNALRKNQQLDQAIACFQRALRIQPDFAETHNNLGGAWMEKGQLDQAIACFQRAMQIKPDFAETYHNLGCARLEKGQLDQAMACFQRMLELQPEHCGAYTSLGNILWMKGKLSQAVIPLERALAIKPDCAEAHNNLGNVRKDQGQLQQAIACYQRALAINPGLCQTYCNLGNVWLDEGQLDEAMGCYRKALELNPQVVTAHDNLLYSQHYRADFDARELLAESRRWNQQYAEPLKRFIQPHANGRDPDRRLRIGYVSPDFREHSVAYFLESLLANHDPAQVEVFCYAAVFQADQTTACLQRHALHWQNIVGQSDEQAAEQIRRDGIDILVDLAGHTAGNRLLIFARKPAPVQVTYLGYPDITGLSTIDYRLTDALADPPTGEQADSDACVTANADPSIPSPGTPGEGEGGGLRWPVGVPPPPQPSPGVPGEGEILGKEGRAGDGEQLFRLPHCFLCYCPSPVDDAPAPPRGQGQITFGSFNAHAKINPRLIEIWAMLLRQVPGSRLLLKNKSLFDSSTRDRVLLNFTEQGIASDRLELRGQTQTIAEHLALYHQLDIALDTFPYHGTTTTCESMWMGVPVVTLAGSAHMSRVGVSLLTNVGVPELIAQTPEEYVKIAAELAGDLPRLAELRSTLRQRMRNSPLMDAGRFARAVESAYRQMWRSWCQSSVDAAK